MSDRAAPRVVILCGGQGTRLKEETEFRPKPMVSVGGRPVGGESAGCWRAIAGGQGAAGGRRAAVCRQAVGCSN